MKITKGTWEVRNNTGKDSDNFVASPQHSRWAIAVKIFKDDAILIAEAGTIYNETGCTPRQLAERKAELLTACKTLRAEQKRCNQMTPRMIDAMQACDDAIFKATT